MIIRRSFFIVVLTLSLALSLALNLYLFGELQQAGVSSSAAQQNQLSEIKPKPAIIGLKSATPVAAREGDSRASATINILAEIANLVASQEYFAATALLVELEQYHPGEIEEVKAVKVRWQQAIAAMIEGGGSPVAEIEAKDYFAAERFLQAYLASYPDQAEFLLLYVDLYLARDQIDQAINQAYDIRYHVFEPQLRQGYLNSARNLVLDQSERLLQMQAWSVLAAFCQQVLAMDPQFGQIRLLQAQAQYELGQLDRAENTLDPLLTDPLLAELAQALSQKIEFAYARPAMVPLIRQGQHFIVRGQIDTNSDVTLLLDTGASISVLSQAAFEQLESETQVEFIEELWLDTAGGRVKADIYNITRFELNGYGVDNMHFAVNPYLSDKIDGLLGMNFLRHFDFYIDQTNNVLKLEHK